MNSDFLERLCCPNSGKRLILEAGRLVSEDRQTVYPIKHGIPRFVSESNYADNFGMQWNYFRQTQLDSFSKKPISAERFWTSTGWMPSELKDAWVLDVGCGAGRFAEIALNAGAKVIALDYSNSVDACYANLKHHANLFVVQGDIYSLPFKKNSFDYVYSLGVLQHTPDVAKAFLCVAEMVNAKGKLCVDYYEKNWKNILMPKYWLRPLTKRLPKNLLFYVLKQIVPFLLFISKLFGLVPYIGKYIQKIIPVANYSGVLPLDKKQLEEWALLDTFDWLSPRFDNPQTASTVKMWLQESGAQDIVVKKVGHLVACGTKK